MATLRTDYWTPLKPTNKGMHAQNGTMGYEQMVPTSMYPTSMGTMYKNGTPVLTHPATYPVTSNDDNLIMMMYSNRPTPLAKENPGGYGVLGSTNLLDPNATKALLTQGNEYQTIGPAATHWSGGANMHTINKKSPLEADIVDAGNSYQQDDNISCGDEEVFKITQKQQAQENSNQANKPNKELAPGKPLPAYLSYPKSTFV